MPDPIEHLTEATDNLEDTLKDPKWAKDFEDNPDIADGIKNLVDKLNRALGRTGGEDK